jgi:hypothetical protein
MDLFKRIQDLSSLYDDDGPSAMVPESRPMFADSVRPGFYRGESVVKSHGQKLIELTEAGESSTSIAKKLGLKQQTVSNALNAIDKGIAGDTYKLSKPLKDFFKPKNQFSGKELTKNTELIEAIKKDAPTMSDKEIKSKYNIGKNTLKKIKDKNDIATRSSYLPEGEQKKSIPYAERYTAQEKSDMYKKRKDTETEEDRIKAKERDKKYRDKKFKEYKMEPSSRSPYDDLWKDIARSSKEGDRIQLIEGPKYSSGASYDDFKTRVFLDTKTGETFNYNNLKQYLDSGKLEGVSYNSVIEPYDIKNQIANSGLKEDIQKAYFGEKYKPPKPFRAQNTFHVHHIGGVASDPFSVQLTFADQNLGLVTNKKFNNEWASLIKRNAPLSERKNYLKFVKSKTGDNIAQTLEFPEVGKTRTFGEIGTDMQKLLSNEKFEQIKGLSSFMKSQGITCRLANGINCNMPQAYTKSLNELSEKAAQGNTEAASKLKNFSSKALKTGKVLKNVLGPLAIASEVALEGGIALNKTLETGVPFKQTFGESYLNKLLGPKLQIDVEAERAKEMSRGEEYAMAERGRRMAPFMAQGAPRKDQLSVPEERRLKNRMQQMEEVYPTVAIPQIDLALQDAGLTQQETGMTYPELQDYIKRQSQMQAIADAGGVANMAGGGIAKMAGDRSGSPPESGPNSQGLQGLFNRVKKV